MSRLLGECLREVSLLTAEQVVRALREQVSLLDDGVECCLGEILLKEGAVDAEQLQRALDLQRAEPLERDHSWRPIRIFTSRRNSRANAFYETEMPEMFA